MTVVVAIPGPERVTPPVRSSAIPNGSVAAGYRMRRPRGGRPAVGCAVGAILYRTLHPEVADQLPEVETIVVALP